MSPRPRKASDDDIFAAAYHAMNRHSPHELTLAHIAEQAGVTAGALTQRFGTKRALMLALAEKSAASTGDFMRELWIEFESPVETILAYADCMAGMAQSPESLARSIAWLQLDLADEEFRTQLATQARATRATLHEILDAAITEGELAPNADPEGLSRLLEALLGGSLITWATHREGKADAWLRRDVEELLRPYRTRASRKTTTPRTSPSPSRPHKSRPRR